MSFELTPKSAYWLGAVLTDGWFSTNWAKTQGHHTYRVSIRSIDREFLEAVNDGCEEMVGRRYAIIPRPAPSKNARPQWLIQMTRKDLMGWAIDVTFDKKHVPRFIYGAKREVQEAFLAGVMDGDGWVSILWRPTVKRVEISSFCQIGIASTDPWLDDVKRLTDSMGLPSRGPTVMKRNNPGWREIRRLNYVVVPFVRAQIPLQIDRKSARLAALLRHLESPEAIRLACD